MGIIALALLIFCEKQSRSYDELYKLTGEKNYLLLKQQADTNLQEGHYWQRDTGS